MAAISSTATGGNWSATSSWVGGVVPTNADDATVVLGATITLDTTGLTCKTLTLGTTSGTVSSFATVNSVLNANVGLTVGNASSPNGLLTINKYSVFTIGTASAIYPKPYVAKITLNPSTTGNTVYLYQWGILGFYGDYSFNANPQTLTVPTVPNRTGASYTTGTFDAILASTATSGSSTLVFTNDIGLQSGGGDTLVVATSNTTQSSATQHETVTTTAYNSTTKTATISGTLAYTHNSGGHVMNVTRNIVLQAANSAIHCTIDAAIVGVGGTTSGGWNFWSHVQATNVTGLTGTNTSATAAVAFSTVGVSMYHVLAIQWMSWNYGAFHLNSMVYNAQTATTGSSNYFGNYGFIGASTFAFGSLQVSTVANSWTVGYSGGYSFGSTNSGCTINNCDISQGRFGMTGMNANVFNNCTFSNFNQISDAPIENQFNSCTFTNCASVTYNGPLNNILRTCTYIGSFTSATTPIMSVTNSLATIGSLGVRESNCLLSDGVTLSSRATFEMGWNTQYTSATSPTSGVFPLPSTASVVSQISQIQSQIAFLPLTIRYAIPIAAGATFTLTVPVFTHAWSTLPNNTNLYLQLTVPGSATPVYSIQNVSANDSWNYLTATGTAVTAGFLICDVYISPYEVGSGRLIYVDFPLGMAQSGLIWFDGQPSQQLTPLSQTSTADVWNYPTASAISAGSMGLEVNTTANKVDDNQALIISL